MASVRCETCGKRFSAKTNFEYHKKYANCGDEDTQPPARDERRERRGQSREVTARATGTIHSFEEDRGFGFVATADVDTESTAETTDTVDVFVHISDVDTDTLQTGDRLEFSVVETENGFRCKDATVIKRSGTQEASPEKKHDTATRLGFGRQKDDTAYRAGSRGKSNDRIESFKDDRKYR
ncbi:MULTISPECIES: cold-shock protein [Haloferax]|nr:MULTISPECIES: cold shock domain-containing protein [Haloferax]